MTGFGRAEINSEFGRFTIEISSVNSRFLETVARLPRPMASLEPLVREIITAQTERGKVSVFVGLAEPEIKAGDVIINRNLVRAYHRELKKLKKELQLPGEITINDLLALPDLTRPEKAEPDMDVVWPVLKRGIEKALKQFLSMRAKEGKATAADMRARLKTMTRLLDEVEKATEGSVERYAEKLSARIGELLNGQKADSARLEEEIAVFADRTDIAEECSRLRSHLDQFQSTVAGTDAVGRRLNFILQEMNREVNTIGSKGSDFGISAKVISLKEEIEKLREQVQNVE
jgi:uncharacterized protein (TIGR00255 family)